MKIRDLPGGAMLIETPRYQEYTEILRKLGARGRNVLEIAGNRRISPPFWRGRTYPGDAGASELFAIPIQSRPGWRRLGLDVEVEKLTALIGEVEKQGGEFEHAYDY